MDREAWFAKISEMKSKEIVGLVEKRAEELLSLMGVEAEISVEEDKENEAIKVDISSPDSTGLLIGFRGEVISAIQVALGMMVRQETEEWARVIVNVGDWREKQESQLSDLASQTAERARETGEPQTLYNLNPSQRRMVHMALSEEGDIETESFGEGKDRYLVVKPKAEK